MHLARRPTWMRSAPRASAALVTVVVAPAALIAGLLAPPAAAAPRQGIPRADIGVDIDADLLITPGSYTPGQSLTIAVTGSLTTTATRDVVCHSLEIAALRGSVEVAARYTSTDAAPQLAGDSHAQAIATSLQLDSSEVPSGGALTVTVDLQCSPMDGQGEWSVLDAVSTRIATSLIRQATGTVSVSTDRLFPDDEIRTVRPVVVSGLAAGAPVTVTVIVGEATVWKSRVQKAAYRVTIPLKRTRQAGIYRVVVSSRGDTAETTFRVSRGWAPLTDSVASWPRCSTITWRYDSKGAPSGGDSGMISDLTAAFDRFATLTGLTFTESADSEADIRVGWGKAPYDGPDAVGGAADMGGFLGSGVLTMFRTSDWARTPGFGTRGRGSLLYHEIGHVLGLGHVSDQRMLMYPYYTFGQSPLTPQSGDIAGLRELYDPDSCR